MSAPDARVEVVFRADRDVESWALRHDRAEVPGRWPAGGHGALAWDTRGRFPWRRTVGRTSILPPATYPSLTPPRVSTTS